MPDTQVQRELPGVGNPSQVLSHIIAGGLPWGLH